MLAYAITVLIVNYNTTDFIEMSLYSLKKLTKNKYKVVICDNGSLEKEKIKLMRLAEKYHNVEVFFRKQSQSGSMGHGEALNILIDKIDTEYGVILDADAIFLIKDWDEILINELGEKTKIIGTPPVFTPNNLKPTDFPLMYAILFETETFRRLNIDMRPKDIRSGQDTGWEMREKYLQANLKAKTLIVENTRTYKEGPFKKVLCAEFYHNGDKNIFVSHFGRGATLGRGKFKEKSKLLSFSGLEEFFKKLKGIKQKEDWLAICKRIIDKEAKG